MTQIIVICMFYHAYGNGAFALSRATGYRVLRKHRKGGDILVCGFPANQLDMVLQRIREAGGEVEPAGENTFLLRGVNVVSGNSWRLFQNTRCRLGNTRCRLGNTRCRSGCRSRGFFGGVLTAPQPVLDPME